MPPAAMLRLITAENFYSSNVMHFDNAKEIDYPPELRGDTVKDFKHRVIAVASPESSRRYLLFCCEQDR